MVVIVDENPLKQSSRKMRIQVVQGDERIDPLWGFLPEIVRNDCIKEKWEYMWYHYSLQPSQTEKQYFPWGVLTLFFSINEMFMIVWMIEGWLPQAIVYLLEI